jgi:hypothetical protein
MENKQTAVQWLIETINESGGFIFTIYYKELFNQAKQMEKEQIIDSFDEGFKYDINNGGGEQYYNETYGK